MDDAIAHRLAECVKKYSEVRLLILFGSRSRHQAREDSDWDLGFIANRGFDYAVLYTDLVLLLKTDKVDLFDLSRASGLLRFRAVRDGTLIYEASKDEYVMFWHKVVHFWCDAGSLIRSEYDAILEELE